MSLGTWRAAAERAESVLRSNIVEVTVGDKRLRHAIPSPAFYVHQWFWDSCCHAMGLAHIGPEDAVDELRSLVAGQWRNGQIGAITYNPAEYSYYPKAECWDTAEFSAAGIVAAGIAQPPLLAISVERVAAQLDVVQREAFLAEILPSVVSYHEYLRRHRDPEESGLLTMIHPWESGCDNSPRWDRSLATISVDDVPTQVIEDVDKNRSDTVTGKTSHRPNQDDYYRYMYLVHLYNELHWDVDTIVATSPFAIKDILFNSAWVRANESLARLTNDAVYEEWAEQGRAGLHKTWDAERRQFCDVDVSNGKWEPIHESTIAMFTPLWCAAAEGEVLDGLLARLSDPEEFWPECPVPTTGLNSSKFDLLRYWRGPTWPITNTILIEGLLRTGETSERARLLGNQLLASTLDMIADHGFSEYYQPTGTSEAGALLGFGRFSWSAALFLHLFHSFASEN